MTDAKARTKTLWTIVGADNILHIYAHGVPHTYRPGAASQNRSLRPFYLNKEMAVAAAREQQAPGTRWGGCMMVLLTVTVPVGIIDTSDEGTMTAFDVHLTRAVTPDELSSKARFLRVLA